MLETILSLGFIHTLLIATIRMSTPMLFTALGEMYSEKAGLVNIGLDGIMTIGSLFGFLGTYITGSPLLGIVFGVLGGIVINMLYAFATITIRANQIVNGMALNILCPALATFIYRSYFGIKTSLDQVELLSNIKIPLLGNIPFFGDIFFNQNILVYFSFLLTIFSIIFFSKTKAGLNYKAVGEYPKAAESLGINVIAKKYIACILCGGLAGLGGAYLTTCYISSFSDGVVAGRGFIALSAVIFGRWKPSGIFIATLIFGFADALQLRLQVLDSSIPYQLLAMLPYAITLISLVLFGSKNSGPKANGQPYYREAK